MGLWQRPQVPHLPTSLGQALPRQAGGGQPGMCVFECARARVLCVHTGVCVAGRGSVGGLGGAGTPHGKALRPLVTGALTALPTLCAGAAIPEGSNQPS